MTCSELTVKPHQNSQKLSSCVTYQCISHYLLNSSPDKAASSPPSHFSPHTGTIQNECEGCRQTHPIEGPPGSTVDMRSQGTFGLSLNSTIFTFCVSEEKALDQRGHPAGPGLSEKHSIFRAEEGNINSKPSSG